MAGGNATQQLQFLLRIQAERRGAPLRWDLDMDQPPGTDGPLPAGWVDPDSWLLTFAGERLPIRVDRDTLDGRRSTLRFRAPVGGAAEIGASCTLRSAPRAPSVPPDEAVPFVGSGEALGLGAASATGDLHVGLQTAVELVDWFGRGQLDLLLTCHLHEGGAFVYGAVQQGEDQPEHVGATAKTGWPTYRRIGRLPGFGDDGQGYNGRLRAVDFHGEGRFDLLECRRSGIRWYRNNGELGAPAFAEPVNLPVASGATGIPAPVQSLCPIDLDGDGRISLIVGTNDWSAYWPPDVSAWDGKPGYRPYADDGSWRGGRLRGGLYLLRNSGPIGQRTADVSPPRFAAPVALCHEDGAPLEVYGLAGPAIIPAADAAAGFDLLVSDFLDRLWYFRNVGRPGADGLPRFAARTPVRCTSDLPPPLDCPPTPPNDAPPDYTPAQRLPDELVLPTCMHALAVAPRHVGSALPGDKQPFDLLVGAEDGYVRLLRWAGRTKEGVPIVEPPRRLQEYGAHLSVGAKACPNVVDWDGDGHPDLVIGNAAGQVLLARNAGQDDPGFSAPEPILASERPLWLMAGSPGTIQGPSEVKWGYINPGVGPWSPLGQQAGSAIVCGDALGNNTLYLRREAGSGGASVGRGRRIHLLRDGRWQPLLSRWRCRPQLVDWGDGETVYVQVDDGGVAMRYRILADGPESEDGAPHVTPLGPLRFTDGTPVKLDADTGGSVGRLKLAVTDWDGDGLPDLLVGTNGNHPPGRNTVRKATVWLLRNVGSEGKPLFTFPEIVGLDAGVPARFGGHSCVPAPCFFFGGDDASGARRPDLLVGSENGRIYAYQRAYIEATAGVVALQRVTAP